jgi:prepilin-type N-terminal cleavage/methylation domain-containing protein/prepilin-type processing-associated H-X9-DG protein
MCIGSAKFRHTRRPRALAFTLVELLVVIAIIAVLLTVLVVAMKNARAVGKRVQCSVRLGGIGKALSMYMTGYDPYMPTLEDPSYNSIQHYYTYRRQNYNGKAGYFWCGLGCLYACGLIDNAFAFYCPATEGWRQDYDKGIGNDRKWGSVTGFLKVTKGYVYWPLSKDVYTQKEWNDLNAVQNQNAVNYLPGYPKSPVRQAELNRAKSIATDYSFHEVKGSGWNLNAVFADGHVIFQVQPRDTDGVPMVHTSGQVGALPDGSLKFVPIAKFMNAILP